MNKEEVIELIEYLKDQISGPAEQIFRWAVKSAFTEALIWIAVGSVILLAGLWSFTLLATRMKAQNSYGDEWFYAQWWGVVGMLAGGILILLKLHTLLNAEYVALRSLLP